MMATAFMGYVLPWGQMSFWGATVITNLFSAIPLVGDWIVTWLWGGFSVDNPTLNRFFSLHYLLPFVIAGFVVLHIWALHVKMSNNPMGIDIKGPQDTIPFHPYYTVKDMFGLGVFLIVFAAFVFCAPNYHGPSGQLYPGQPAGDARRTSCRNGTSCRSTRSCGLDPGRKLLGVIAMFASILVLFVLPWLDTSPVRSARFRPLYKWFFWIFWRVDCDRARLRRRQPAGRCVLVRVQLEGPLGLLATLYYFFHFLILMPILGRVERPKPLPYSIAEPVLGGGGSPAGAPAKPMEKA